MARWSPWIRTYRALRAGKVCTLRPGLDIVTVAAVDHESLDEVLVSMLYRDAYAVSQFNSTRLI